MTVRLDSCAADAVSNFLWDTGAVGVVEEGEGPLVGLRAFFPPGTDPGGTRDRLARFLTDLDALAVPIGPAGVDVSQVPDEAWAEAWRAHFRPLCIGQRLLVTPPWEHPDANGRLVIVIEPGRAFGTGSHGSTGGCLELVEQALGGGSGEEVLDVGTGSGILAIAAARLGARTVTALDVDPDAVAAARANAVRNGVADRVRVEAGSPDAWEGRAASLVVANLLGSALIELAPVLARCCTDPGRLILGGLLTHERLAVASRFAAEGFAVAEIREREGWASLLLVR